MTPGARLQAAIDILTDIDNRPRMPADAIMAQYLKSRRYIGAKDRRNIGELVYGILRRRARLDWWLAREEITPDARSRMLADQALTALRSPEDLFDLGIGKYGLEELSPSERAYMGRLKGKPIFHHEMPEWVRGEVPEWTVPYLEAAFGEALATELGMAREEAPLDLRVNILKGNRDAAQAALMAEGLKAEPTPWSPLGLRLKTRVPLISYTSYRSGLVEVQDEGSQLVALLAGAKPGMAVVDFCSGAGGKTLALAAGMDNKGRIVACDINEVRMNRGQERFRRAGVHNVTRRVLSTEHDKWIKRSAGSFDRVLVDAPCTGTGTWRRNPDARWHLSPNDLSELTALQASILDSAARLVKEGGRLVYATCSVLLPENEEQIAAFLARHPEFRLLPLPQVWAEEAIGTPCPVSGDVLRLSPAGHGTDGFFSAILERLPNAKPPQPAGAEAVASEGEAGDDSAESLA